MATPIEQTFEPGVVDGTAISSTNAPSPTLMASPIKNASTTINFENDVVLPGTMFSGRVQSLTNNAGYTVQNFSPTTTTTRVAGRFYIWQASGMGANAFQILQVRSASAQVFNLSLDASQRLTIYNGANTQVATAASALPLDQWVRVEWQVQVGTTTSNGHLVVAYYLGESTTPIQTVYNSSTANTGTAALTVVRHGWSSWLGAPTLTTYYGMIRIEERASGFIGPRPVYSGGMTPTVMAQYASTANVTTSGAVAVTVAANVGDLVVVSAALGSTGLASNGVTDSKGNTYTRLDFSEQTTVGTTSALYYSVLTTALTTSDTITLARSPSGGVAFVAYKIVGADPTTPFGTPIKANGNSNFPSAGAITVPVGGIVLSSLATQVATTVTAGPDFDYRQIGFSTSTGSGNPRQVFASWSWLSALGAARLGSAQGWALVAVPVNPASSAPPEGGFDGAYAFGAATAQGSRMSDGGFAAGYAFGPALAGGSRMSDGGFAGSYTFGPAGFVGDRESTGNFAGAYAFGPAAADGSRDSDGDFSGAYAFGPASAQGSIDAEGSFSGTYTFGPAAFDGAMEAAGGFSSTYAWGPAGFDGKTPTGADFEGAYSFGPATANGEATAEGGFDGAFSFGPAEAEGYAGVAGGFSSTFTFGPAEFVGSTTGEGGFEGSFSFGPALAGGITDYSGGFAGAYAFGPAEAEGSTEPPYCWPNPVGLVPLGPLHEMVPLGPIYDLDAVDEHISDLVPLGPSATLIPMGPVTGLVPLGPVVALAPLGPVYELVVVDPCP